MIKKEECTDVCDIMYAIRDCINRDSDAFNALSLANDLYYKLLRIALEDRKIVCNLSCNGGTTDETKANT